jgi:hypothetical protein
MYKIIGGDGNEYGPVSAEQLRAWIAEGRVNNHTKLQREGETEWLEVGACAEFTDVMLAQARAALESGGTATPPPFSKAGGISSPGVLSNGDYQLDLGGLISGGWNLTMKNLGVLIGAVVVYFAVMMGVAMVSIIPIVGPIIQFVGNLIVVGPMLGGLYFLTLRLVRGEAAEVTDVFAGFQRAFLNLFLGHIVTALLAACCLLPAAAVGVLSVIPAFLHHQRPDPQQFVIVLVIAGIGLIPMIYLQINWMFSLPLIVDRGLNFWTAMKLSWSRVSIHWWQNFGLLILTGLVNLAGVLLCCVGLIIALPLTLVAMMLAYEIIFSGTDRRA